MQTQKIHKDDASYNLPTMRMWGWIDMQALCQEARLLPLDRKLTEAKMSDEDQHDFYKKKFAELRVNHTKMSDEESKARLAHVKQWAADQGHEHSPRTVGGHDLKSVKAGWDIIRAVANSDHAHKVLSARKIIDQADQGTKEQDRAYLHGTLMTSHGEHTNPYEDHQIKAVHDKLKARRKYLRQIKKKTVKPNHEHGYATISNDTGVSQHHVESMGRGTEHNPMRALANQARKFVNGGGKLTHEWVAKAMARTAILKKRDREESTQVKSEKRAVAAGAALGKDKKGDKEAEGLGGISQDVGKLAQRAKPSIGKGAPKWHHPVSKKGKAGHPIIPSKMEGPLTKKKETMSSRERHEALIARLNSARPDNDQLSPQSTIDVRTAVHNLHKQGHSPERIADLLDHPHANVERILAGKHGDPLQSARVSGTGARPRTPGEPLRKAMSREAKATAKAREKAGVAKSAIEATKEDLHRLYPLTIGGIKRMPPHSVAAPGGVKRRKRESEADFAARVERVQKEREELAQHRRHATISKAPAGFVTPKGAPKHPGDFKEPRRKKSQSDEDHANNVAAARDAHQQKLDAHYESLIKSHAGVHHVWNTILDRMADRSHPVTYYDAKERAGHDPKLRAHLGIDPKTKMAKHQFSSAMSNAMDRLEAHGTESAAVRLAGGVTQKPTKEPESSPERREKTVRMAGEEQQSKEISPFAKRVVAKREQKKDAESLADKVTKTDIVPMAGAGKPAPGLHRTAPKMRLPRSVSEIGRRRQTGKKPWYFKPGTTRVTPAATGRAGEQEPTEAQKAAQARALPKGTRRPASEVRGPKVPQSARREARRAQSIQGRMIQQQKKRAGEKAEAEKKGLQPIEKSERKLKPGEFPERKPTTKIRAMTAKLEPSKSTPGLTRAKITPTTSKSPKPPKPAPKPEPMEPSKTRILPGGKGRVVLKSGGLPRSAPGVGVRRREPGETEEPWEKKVGSFFKRAMVRGKKPTEESLLSRTPLVLAESVSLLVRERICV